MLARITTLDKNLSSHKRPVDSLNAETILFFHSIISNEHPVARSNTRVVPRIAAFCTYENACTKVFANVANISEGKEIAFLMMFPSRKFQFSPKQAGESIEGQAS